MIFTANLLLKMFAALPDCTVLMGVPTFYTRLLQQPGLNREHVSNVRVFICGSAPLTEQTFAAWEQATGQRILERYGMSETIINTSNPLDGDRVPGTVGFALPNQEVRIADENGLEVPKGEVGTIEMRGPNVFSGYWNLPDKTAEEIRADGFFITGDLGTQDAEGRVAIVGGLKTGVWVATTFIQKRLNGYWMNCPMSLSLRLLVCPMMILARLWWRSWSLQIRLLWKCECSLTDQLARFKQPKACCAYLSYRATLCRWVKKCAARSL